MQAEEATPHTPAQPETVLLQPGDPLWVWTDASLTRKRLYKVLGVPGQGLDYRRDR